MEVGQTRLPQTRSPTRPASACWAARAPELEREPRHAGGTAPSAVTTSMVNEDVPDVTGDRRDQVTVGDRSRHRVNIVAI